MRVFSCSATALVKRGLVAMVSCLVLAGCGGGGGGSSAAPAVTAAPTILVSATKPYTDSGKSVTAGEQITITATGTFNNGRCISSPTLSCDYGPAGAPWSTCENDQGGAFNAPGLACWSLIGKIGASGTPFEIGAADTFAASTNGELYVGVNDNYFSDNSGGWTATLTL